MKHTILILAGMIALGSTSLMADGSVIQVVDTTVVASISDSEIEDATVGLNVETEHSIVQVVGSTVVAGIADSEIEEGATVGINVDDHDE